jgi:dipeptidyl aminopeptidase/acylaminoacyl peptidase
VRPASLIVLALVLALAGAGAAVGAEPADRPVAIPAAGGVTLAGTLTVPPGPGPFPAAVLVSGLGPNDRDGGILPGGRRPYADWARALARRGVAVLRYDKRGIGRSGGSNLAWLDVRALTADAVVAVRALAARPEAAGGRAALVGHSQGGDIALAAAARLPSARRVVTLAAPGRPLGELAPASVALVRPLVGAAGAAATLETDPRRDAAAARQPALLLHGTADSVVPASDVARLAGARRAAGRPTSVLRVPGADHFLTVGAGGRVPAGVFDRVARFLRA